MVCLPACLLARTLGVGSGPAASLSASSVAAVESCLSVCRIRPPLLPMASTCSWSDCCCWWGRPGPPLSSCSSCWSGGRGGSISWNLGTGGRSFWKLPCVLTYVRAEWAGLREVDANEIRQSLTHAVITRSRSGDCQANAAVGVVEGGWLGPPLPNRCDAGGRLVLSEGEGRHGDVVSDGRPVSPLAVGRRRLQGRQHAAQVGQLLGLGQEVLLGQAEGGSRSRRAVSQHRPAS